MKSFIIIFSLMLIVFNISIAQEIDFYDKIINSSDLNQSEVHISINKRFPNILLISSNIHNNTLFFSQGFYYSLDGGNSWSGKDTIPNNSLTDGDPVTGFDSQGNYFLITMAKPRSTYYVFDAAYDDNDLNDVNSWVKTIATGVPGLLDKEMAIFDDNESSPYTDNFYCVWTGGESETSNEENILFNRSINNLTSFENHILLSDNFGRGANVQNGPNGEVYVCWADYPVANEPAEQIGFNYSLNGGQSFGNLSYPVQYNGYGSATSGEVNFGGTRMNDFPSMAVDKSCDGEFSGRIYIAYPTLDFTGKAVIELIWSDDNGAIWSLPLTISPNNVAQSFFPWIAVDPLSGMIAVVFHSIVSGSNEETETYVAYSSDGGENFDVIQVNNINHDRAPIKPSNGYAGDYIGIDFYDGLAYAAWADNRTGNYQAYVSKLDLRGIPTKKIVDETFYFTNNVYQSYNIHLEGNNTINSFADVELIAKNEIRFKDGFHAKSGSDLIARISDSSCQQSGGSSGNSNQSLDKLFDQPIKKKQTKLFPNPSEGVLQLESEAKNISDIKIYNLFGGEMKSQNLRIIDKNASLDLTNLPNGPYFIRISFDDGSKEVKKIIIQR